MMKFKNRLERNLVFVGGVVIAGFVVFGVAAIAGLDELALKIGYSILAPTPLWIFIAIVVTMLEEVQ